MPRLSAACLFNVVLCPVSTIPLTFFRCRFAVPVSRLSQNPLHGHRLRTPATDTINGQKFATSQHLDMLRDAISAKVTDWGIPQCMLGSGIAMWQIYCRIVVSSSVGGVRSRCPCSGVWLFPYTVAAAVCLGLVDVDDWLASYGTEQRKNRAQSYLNGRTVTAAFCRLRL